MGGAGYRVVFGVAAAVVIGGEEATYFVAHPRRLRRTSSADSWYDRRKSGWKDGAATRGKIVEWPDR